MERIKNHPTSDMTLRELDACVKSKRLIPPESVVKGEILEAIYDRLPTFKNGSKMKKPIRDVIVGKDSCGTQYNCLYILYEDGSIDNLSANKLFSKSKIDQHPGNVRKAARFEILEQVLDLKKSRANGFEYEVDHANVSFENLFNRWKESESLRDGDIELAQDPQLNKTFRNRQLAKCWYDFHRDHAQLELVTSEEHKRRTYNTP